MNYNYHCHTYLCSHAEPSPEEYIKTAIEGGIEYMGFSEHAPLKFENGKQSSYRLQVEDVEKYFGEIGALREKYKDKIDIKIGYEMEYYADYFERMLEDAISAGAEYLILGQHFTEAEIHPTAAHSYKSTEDKEQLFKYVKAVIAAIKSGVFSYVAHPDIFNFFGDDELYKEEFRKICVASRECDVPLEINFLGIRTQRRYPNEMLVAIMGEEKCPVTFGFDAHGVVDAADLKSLVTAEELVKKYNLNYVGRPKIKSLRKN